MLRWIYNKYKHRFYNFMVEDFYGDIPESVREPSIEFLSNARGTLERFWSIQAYQIQRRSISDPKNAQVYQGFLLCIRTLLAVVSKGKKENRPEVKVDEDRNPLENVKDFINSAKAKK